MGKNRFKILVVEDEANIREFMSTILETEGYQMLEAESCATAELMFASHCPDLVILDLGLPDRDGTELISCIRQDSVTPIVVLSARTTDDDKVGALDMGANDYITKPFSTAELLARVRSALRNRHYGPESNGVERVFRVNDLEILFDSRQIKQAGREIKLTQTEYNIMAVLAHHAGKVMTYSAIIRNVWGSADDGSIKKLQVNMANIRKKLSEKPGDRRYVCNELGVGYRMMSDENP